MSLVWYVAFKGKKTTGCGTKREKRSHLGLLLSAAGDRELAPAVGNHLKPMLPLQCLGGFRALVPCDTQASLVRTIAVALVQAQLVQAAHHEALAL